MEKYSEGRKRTWMLPTAIGTGVMSLLSLIPLSCGIENNSVPAGHEGYQVNKPLLIGKHEYVGTLVGPKSTGMTWRDFVDPVIDMRPKTYSEDYKILSKDNLNVSFRSHAILRLKSGTCKEVVENFGADQWFSRNVKEPYRTIVRESVRPHEAYAIKDQSESIATSILSKMQKKYEDTPIIVESVSIGNIDYPPKVNTAVEEKLAKQQELEKKEFEKQIATQDAEIKITEAGGIAEAQKIINETLTPNYLQHEAIMAQQKLANSPNTTIIYIPVGQSGIPVVHNSEAQDVKLEDIAKGKKPAKVIKPAAPLEKKVQ